jgi:small subunit ribosomal protein S15
MVHETPLQKFSACATMGTMLTKQKKTKTIKEVAVHATDTGSPEVQVAVLTKRIDELAAHLKKHLKDKHSRRGLLQMVADRRTHLKYLEGKDKKRYGALVKKLGLKR